MSRPHTSLRPVSVCAGLLLWSAGCTDLPDDELRDIDGLADLLAEVPVEELTEQDIQRLEGSDPSVSVPDEFEMDPESPLDWIGDLRAPGEPGDPVTIADETGSINNGVRRITPYYTNKQWSSASYASPRIVADDVTCSATMIGPNLLMTAAHCGVDPDPDAEVFTRVYRERDITMAQQEDYECHLLFHTFPETDLAIFHCPPEGSQLSLGDRYGWVDIDPQKPALGDTVFSTFHNPISDLADPNTWHSLLTRGTVLDSSVDNHWANPNNPIGSVTHEDQQYGAQHSKVMHTSLWSKGGASGSAQFDASTGDIVVGPLSTGSNDGPNRWALSMRDYLYYGHIYERGHTYCKDEDGDGVIECSTSCVVGDDDPDCRAYDNTINGDYISAPPLSLDPTDYEDTWADQDLDWFFDLPADVSDLEGENAKGLYHLDFDSRRQNRLWDAGPASAIIEDEGRVGFDVYEWGQTNQWAELIRHERLNLAASTTYTVTFTLKSETGFYRVCRVGGGTNCSPWFLDNDDVAQTHTLSFQTNTAGADLVIEGWNTVGSIYDVTVAEPTPYYGTDGRVRNDFDSFDARQVWYEPDVVDPSVLPDGYGVGVGWAGRLYKSGSSTGYDYDLATDALPFSSTAASHQVCFRYRRDPATNHTGSSLGYLRIEEQDGSYVTGQFFSPSTNWALMCKAVSEDLATGENLRIKFGVYGYGGYHRSGILIDSVEVRYIDGGVRGLMSACCSGGRAARPSSIASASFPRTTSIDRMLSSLPGIGMSTGSGSLSVSISATVVTPIRFASLMAMCSRFGPTMTSASGSRFMSRMPSRFRRILSNSRLNVETIFFE